MDNRTIIETLVNTYAAGNQREFARMLGVAHQTITNWKRATPPRSLDYLLIYQKCANLSGDWLLSGGEGDIFRAPAQTHTTAAAHGKKSVAVVGDIQVTSNGDKEKVALLKQILEEKERLIQVLLSQNRNEENAK